MESEDKSDGTHFIRDYYAGANVAYFTNNSYYYNMPSASLNPKKDYVTSIHSGAWTDINLDLMKYIKGDDKLKIPSLYTRMINYKNTICSRKSIDDNQCVIHPFLSPTKNFLDDYYISEISVGWEVSSLHDVEAHISNMSLSYTK